jgi:hypothetical protein
VEAGVAIVTVGDKIAMSQEPDCTIDPDPIAVLTACVAGIGMLSSVVSTVVNLIESRRRSKDERRIVGERLADVLISRDRLRSTALHISQSIGAFRPDANLALSFREDRPSSRLRDGSPRARFQFGSVPVAVHGASREMWNLLVDDVCDNIKAINRNILDYNGELTQLFEKLRAFQASSPDQTEYIERIIGYTMQRAHAIQAALDKFQSLTSKTPLNRALAAFADVRDEAQDLIATIEDLTSQLIGRFR